MFAVTSLPRSVVEEAAEAIEIEFGIDGYSRSSDSVHNSEVKREILDNPESDGFQDQDEARKKYRMLRRSQATVHFCEKCNKTIRYPSKIAEHMRKHTLEKPYQCHLCGSRFSQGHSLRAHMRSHSGEKPYKCSFCDKSFASLSQTKNHEKLHIQENSDLLNDPSEHRVTDVVEHVYLCPLVECGFNSESREEVEDHIALAHAHMTAEWIDQESEEHLYEEQYARIDGTVDCGEGGMVEMIMEEEEEQVPMVDQQMSSRLSSITLLKNEPTEIASVPAAEDSMFEHRERPLIDEHEQDEVHPPSTSFEDTTQVYYQQPYIVGMDQDQTDVLTGEAVMTTGDDPIGESSFPYIEEVHVDEPPNHTSEVEVVTTGDDDQLLSVVNEEVYDGYIGGELTNQHHLVADSSQVDASSSSYVMVDDDGEGESGRVRVLCDPRPPKRGRTAKYERYLRQHQSTTREVEVDASVVEMAAHVKPVNYSRRAKRGDPRPAKNLDWIIDAVARGVDVDYASPHNRRKPVMHECEFCGKIEKYPSKIQAHLRTHTGEKPFKCDICGMRFSQRTPLRMHVRRHLNQKPYLCLIDGCTERFVSGALLNDHQNRNHFGERRRFVCTKGCGRTFTSARSERRHSSGTCQYSTNRIYGIGDMAALSEFESMYMEEDRMNPMQLTETDDIISNMQPAFL